MGVLRARDTSDCREMMPATGNVDLSQMSTLPSHKDNIRRTMPHDEP